MQFCNSFSGCVHMDKSKCLTALSTDAQHVRVFKKTLIGGFSCVDTRLAFDTQILLAGNENEKVLLDWKIDEKSKLKEYRQKY